MQSQGSPNEQERETEPQNEMTAEEMRGEEME